MAGFAEWGFRRQEALHAGREALAPFQGAAAISQYAGIAGDAGGAAAAESSDRLSAGDAAAKLHDMLGMAFALRLSGVRLKDESTGLPSDTAHPRLE
jgi:hypothetical protein